MIQQNILCVVARNVWPHNISWTFHNGLTNTSFKIKCASFFPRFLIMASSHKRSFWSVSHYWVIFLNFFCINKWWKIGRKKLHYIHLMYDNDGTLWVLLAIRNWIIYADFRRDFKQCAKYKNIIRLAQV